MGIQIKEKDRNIVYEYMGEVLKVATENKRRFIRIGGNHSADVQDLAKEVGNMSLTSLKDHSADVEDLGKEVGDMPLTSLKENKDHSADVQDLAKEVGDMPLTSP